MVSKSKPKIIAIVGPTATGKSDLAVLLASEMKNRSKGKVQMEIVSADSRQVYKELDIGSAKIPAKEMRGIPHHMLDVVSPKKVFSVADYQKKAKKVLADLIKLGKIPVIVGGTGFYIDALLYNQTFPEVPPNPGLRKKLEKYSLQKLQEELHKLDPERYEGIDLQNPVRLIRAIEIAAAIGKVPKTIKESPYEILWIGLDLPDEELKKKIETRLTKRLRKGMVEEVENVHTQGVSWKRLEQLGLEYRYIAQFLQNKISRQEMIDVLKQESWRYAKSQRKWFKRNKEITWFEPKTDSIKKAKIEVCTFLN